MWVSKLHLVAHWIPGQNALLNDCLSAKLIRVESDLIIEDHKVLSTDEIVDFFIALANDSFRTVVRMAAIEGNNEKLGRVRVVISSDHHVRFICAQELALVEVELTLEFFAYWLESWLHIRRVIQAELLVRAVVRR